MLTMDLLAAWQACFQTRKKIALQCRIEFYLHTASKARQHGFGFQVWSGKRLHDRSVTAALNLAHVWGDTPSKSEARDYPVWPLRCGH